MGPLSIRRTRVSLASVALALAACNGDGPSGPPPAITIALSGTTLTVPQGQSGTVTVSVGRLNGFASAVTLSLEGAPAGVTGAFNPASVPNGTTTSTLTVSASGSAAVGTHTLTVRGRGQGVTDQTATLTLTVVVPPTLDPTSLSLQQGQSGTAAVTIARGGSFTGAVDLSAEGVPTGVTVSFNPATIAAGSTTSTMTVAVGTSAATGQFTITVRARGQGVTDQTVALTLTVTAPAYTIALNPTGASVQQGGNTAVQVSVTRSGGFADAVTLSLEGAPAGVTSTFNPNPATGNTSTLTINVGAGTALGNHTLTVRGTAPGLTDRTATFALQVTSSTGGTSVSFRFCESPLPIWVGYQDDMGPWTRVTTGANNTYTFTLTSRGGIAIVTPEGTGYHTEVVYGTASELATIGASWDVACSFAPGTKQLTGTVAGVSAASEDADIILGPASTFVTGGQTTYTLQGVPEGALDLFATRGTFSSTAFITNKLILRRGLNLPNGSSIPVLDFNAVEAVAPAPGNLTIGGLGADQAAFFVSYRTAAGTEADLTINIAGVGATHAYQGVPSSIQVAGDLHQFLVFANPTGPNPMTSRLLLASFHAAGNHTVTLGPDLGTPTVSVVASSPYVRYRMQLARQSEYSETAAANFEQPATLRNVTVLATAGYFGGAPATWDLSIPDLSGASGFDANWGLQPNTGTNWAVTAADGSLFAIPGDGTTIRAAQRTGGAPPGIQSAMRSLRTLRPTRRPMTLRLPRYVPN
jgi:hypothetical protein